MRANCTQEQAVFKRIVLQDRLEQATALWSDNDPSHAVALSVLLAPPSSLQ